MAIKEQHDYVTTDNTGVAINAMRKYLNSYQAQATSNVSTDDQPVCMLEWITWLISLLGKDHDISKQLLPMTKQTNLPDDEMRKRIYDVIADNS